MSRVSAYARQFLGRMQKPDVERIDNIPPAIAIQQKVTNRNPRSTVGSVTEIYEYLKLLFARVGRTYSPVSNKEVRRHTIRDVVRFMEEQELGKRLYLLSPIVLHDRTLGEQLDLWRAEGFVRLLQARSDRSSDGGDHRPHHRHNGPIVAGDLPNGRSCRCGS